jgi:hypothetical protein
VGIDLDAHTDSSQTSILILTSVAGHCDSVGTIGNMECSKGQSDANEAGIGCLAPETLLGIFALVHDPTSLHQITALAGVCQRWRHVSLSYSPFWTTIRNAGPDLAALALAGSNDALLNVDYDLIGDKSSDEVIRARRHAGFDAVWRRGRHAARLRTLRVVLNVTFAYEVVLGPLGFSRPPNKLERVHLIVDQGNTPIGHHMFNPTFFAPQLSSFSCELREFDGTRVTPFLPVSAATSWPNLRELHLRKFGIPLQTWVGVLSQLSHLETLSLSGFLSGQSRKLRNPSVRVPLLALKTLTLEEIERNITALFCVLRLSPLVEVSVQVHDYRGRLGVREFFPVLSQWLSKIILDDTTHPTLCIHTTRDTVTCVFAPPMPPHLASLKWSLRIKLVWSMRPDAVSFVGAESLFRVTLPESVTLDLCATRGGLLGCQLFELLCCIPSLRTLIIQGLNMPRGAYDLFEFVSSAPDDVKVGGRSEQPRGLEGNKRAENNIDWGGRRVV